MEPGSQEGGAYLSLPEGLPYQGGGRHPVPGQGCRRGQAVAGQCCLEVKRGIPSAAREEERRGNQGRRGRDAVGTSPFLFSRLLPWVAVSRWGF